MPIGVAAEIFPGSNEIRAEPTATSSSQFEEFIKRLIWKPIQFPVNETCAPKVVQVDCDRVAADVLRDVIVVGAE
jgi:hypothetical protein